MSEKDAPDYISGLTGCGVVYGIEFTLVVHWRIWYSYQNTSRANRIEAMGLNTDECLRKRLLNAEEDMTGYGNMHFTYSLWGAFSVIVGEGVCIHSQ